MADAVNSQDGAGPVTVDTVVAGLTSIIEPILIIVLGTMVGFIVISVFGPLSNIDSTVGNTNG